MATMSMTAGIEPVAFEQHMLEKDKPADEILQRTWGLKARVDHGVTFEEYRYWAEVEREEEKENNRRYIEERGSLTVGKVLKNRFSKGVHHENQKKSTQDAAVNAARRESVDQKTGVMVENEGVAPPTEEEWKTMSRALRTASWGTIFYLITTDILGWGSTAFVFSSVGFGTGAALYIVFGIAAAASGYMIWKIFLALDSSRYPMLSFGDPFFRIYGRKMRHFINITQSLQQFMTVCVLILGAGTIIAQLANENLCFIVCMLIIMIAGMIIGSVRSLQRLGWLCNACVWMNVVSFIIIMVAVARNPINYSVVTSSTLIKNVGPIMTFAGVPPDQYQQQAHGTAAQLNGINQMVYSYGGALLFVAFLAEMRHPWDFWKGMLCAQTFICIVYIFFGAFVYGHAGQYSASNINQIILPVSLQIVGNVLALLTSLIACLLYFNIGMKTVYIEVFQEILNFPEITSRKGRWMWYALGPVYWIIAFLIAAAVPNLNGISGLVGALLILNFTYTFPALLFIGYRCQADAALPGEGFDPATGVTTRHDGGVKRFLRGYMVNWHINIINTIYFLGGLTCSGLGTWAAVEGLIAVFGPGGTVATSYGCGVPV